MKVVYAPELALLAQRLGYMGFEMHPQGADVEADAVLFVKNFHSALGQRCGPHGALLLNTRGLSVAQTAQALRRRSQIPLF